MADPIVHITNGIPDVGTGNITTLGQTLLDGANIVLGATTDTTVAAGAAGTINSHLRSISRDLVGGVVLQTGGNVIGSVTQSGGPWSVSGTVSIAGTVTVTGTVGATQSGTWNINNIAGTISLPTGAATAAKQPLPGLAGTPSADVLTVQGATSMTPLKVDGSGVTQPVSGNVGITGNVNCVQVTSPWVTSISGNVTCVQSGNWTSRCVGNAGGIFDFSSVQNVATPGQAILIGAEFNAVPTTITTGNSSPLQLDSAANLLVNVKASVLPTGAATSANQPTAAAQGSTTSGQTGLLAEGAVTTASPAYTTGQTSPLSLDTAGNLRVNVVAGGGAGGTSSSFGSAFPATGTAIGVKDNAGTNMTFLQVNASNALKVDGSAVTQPVSGTFWQATQPVSGTVTANQGGTWNVTNISGTVSLPTGASTSANQPTNAAQGSTTSGQTGNLMMGAVTTANPSYTTGQTSPLSLDTSGAVRVNVIAGSGGGGTSSSFGSAFPATGTAIGVMNSSATAMTNLKANASGALVVDGSAVTQPVSGTVTANQGGTWTVQPGNTANTTAWLVTGTGGTFPVTGTVAATQSGTWTDRIVGNTGATLDTPASQNQAMPTNMLMVGGEFNTTPTTITSGNASPLQMNASGSLRVDGSGVTQPVSGTFWQATQPISAASLPLPTGAATAANQPTPAAIGSTTSGQQGALVFGAVTTAAPAYTTAQSDPLSLTTAGALRVDGSGVTQPVSIAAAVTVAQATAANLNATVTGTVAATQSGTWTVQQGTPPWHVDGNVGWNVSDAGNPIKIGGYGTTANPGAVTTGNRVNAIFDKLGKQITVGAIRELKGVQKTSITVATETTVVTAGGAGVFNDVYAIVVTNKSATSVFVDFRDATAGTVRMTLAAPAGDTRGFTVPVDSSMVQAVAANNWTATVSSAVTSIEISVLYVSNL